MDEPKNLTYIGTDKQVWSDVNNTIKPMKHDVPELLKNSKYVLTCIRYHYPNCTRSCTIKHPIRPTIH